MQGIILKVYSMLLSTEACTLVVDSTQIFIKVN